MKKTFYNLSTLEADIRRALEATENADNDRSAAEAFNHLKSKIETYFDTAKDTEKEKWKFRNAAASQAAAIAEFQDEILNGHRIGESAPSEHHIHHPSPEIITDAAPHCLFIQLSFGFVNLLQIALLDVKAKQLYLNSGNVRGLEDQDVQKLLFHCRLYQPEPILQSARTLATDTNKPEK